MGLTNTPSEHSNPNNAQQPGMQPAASGLPCDALVELMPAYSVGAVDPEEFAVINGQLAACPQALTALASYTKVAEALLYSAPPRQAPPAVAQRLRAALGAPSIRPPSIRLPLPSSKPSYYTLLPPPVIQPARRWSFGRILASAAGVVLIAMNIALLVQNQQLRASQTQIAAELAHQNRALIFLAAEEPKEVLLPAAQENSKAQADVLWNDSLGVAIIYVRDFPTLPPDMVYQLWLNKDGIRTSGGLFTVDEQGMGIMVFPIERAIDAYDRMGITPEPAGGSPGPTGSAVVRGPV